MAPRPRRPNGRRRLPTNAVYRAIQAAGGPAAVCRLLDVSLATLARWRRAGRVTDPVAVLHWVAAIHSEPADQLRLARQLAGVSTRRRTARATPR